MADGKVSLAYSYFLGYDKGEDGNLAVNREEAKIIRLIFSDFLTGLSCYAIAAKLTRMGIKTPRGKEKWNQHTVRNILMNEKYKGDALLQKTFIRDFLTKKQIINHGEVPQYYVKNNHEAIIEPEIFDRVQDILKKRGYHGGYSGMNIFSSKLVCGECSSWYSSKIWHSNDKYRKVVWQCNAKFGEKKYCRTPHLTENEIKAAFLRVANSLIKDRGMILEELREDQSMLTGAEELENEQKQLAEQMNVDAEKIQEIIAQNARSVQDQAEYKIRYESLSARFQETKAKYNAVTAEIAQRGIRRREFARFIRTVEALPEILTEFSEELWGGLVDHATVYSKDNIVFTLTSGIEIKA